LRFRAVRKAYGKARVTLDLAMGKSGEVTKSLDDFETKAWNEPGIFLTWIPNVGERWTNDAI
jgi:hypothetical protein